MESRRYNNRRTTLLVETSVPNPVSWPPEPMPIPAEVLRLGKATIPISGSFLLQNMVRAFLISAAALNLKASILCPTATCSRGVWVVWFPWAAPRLSTRFVARPPPLQGTQPAVNPGPTPATDAVCPQHLYALVITPIWIFLERIFVAMGQERDVAAEAS